MVRANRKACVLLLVAVASLPAPSSAQDVPPGTGGAVNGEWQSHALEYRPARDLGILGGGLLTLALTEWVLKDELAPMQCRWCGTNEEGELDVNALDTAGRRLHWGVARQEQAAMWSNIVVLGALPASVLALTGWQAHRSGGGTQMFEDGVIIAQSVVLNGVLNQAVKFAAARERPFVADLPPEKKATTTSPEDNNVSFYSGHTSNAFALAVSAGTVATLRGYPHRWAVWSAGLPLAASVGYFRIAADKHYLTDVLVGAAVGSAVGVAVPLLLHPREETNGVSGLSLSTSPTSFTLSGVF